MFELKVKPMYLCVITIYLFYCFGKALEKRVADLSAVARLYTFDKVWAASCGAVVSTAMGVHNFSDALLVGIAHWGSFIIFGRVSKTRIQARSHNAGWQSLIIHQFASRTAFTLQCAGFVP